MIKKDLSIAILMMQKNEHQLLKPWLLYHGFKFGFDSLFVYDNGSNDEACIQTLKDFERVGVNVIWEKTEKNDFERKGVIFSEKIKSLASEFLFYFPMDCDEFLAVEIAPGEISIDKGEIFSSLESYINENAPLSIGAAYDNNPLYPSFFVRNVNQRKTFFYKETCSSLDCGFHIGKTFSKKDPLKTNIVYFHYHFKDYDFYVESAKEKLKGRISDFSHNSLIEFKNRKGKGHHVVGKLLDGPEVYYSNLRNNYNNNRKNYYKVGFFSDLVRALGLCFESDEMPDDFDAYNVSNWRGYVENILFDSGILKISGWYIDLGFEGSEKKIILSINGVSFSSKKLLFKERPDVKKSQKFCGEEPGFSAFFEIDSMVNLDQIDSIAVYIERNGVVNRFSLSDKVLRTKSLIS